MKNEELDTLSLDELAQVSGGDIVYGTRKPFRPWYKKPTKHSDRPYRPNYPRPAKTAN